MTMREVVVLPRSTAETEEGPILEHRPGQATLRYDAEGPDSTLWVTLQFGGVVALRFTPDPACEAWMIAAYSRVAIVDDSQWLAQLRAAAAPVALEISPSRKHFVLYFDHVGCWELLAEDIEINPDLAGSATNRS